MALRVWLPLNGNLNNQGLSKLTSNGTPTFLDSGKMGKCISIAQRVSFTGLPKLDKFTILFWLKGDSCSVDWADSLGFTSKQADGSSASMFRFEATTTSRACSFHNNSPYAITQGSRILITGDQWGQWHHCGVSYDGANLYTYIDGVLTYTDTGLGGYLIDYFHIGETNHIVGGMNDLRVYDECLSQKQVKEISKGLVAHYKLDNPYIETTTNLIQGKNYNITASTGWGAHRMASTEENVYSCVPFHNGNKFVVTYDTSLGDGGGAGIQTKAGNVTLSPSTQYCYSIYLKPIDSLDIYINANFLYRYEFNSSGTKTTEAGVASKANSEYIGDGWYRLWGTFITKDTTAYATFYFFTYCGKNTTYYIGGCQVEQKGYVTPYTTGTRDVEYEQDVSGNGYTAIKNGTLTFNTDSPRYSGSTKFDGSSGCLAIGRPMPTDALTVNAWAYMDNWSSYGGRIGSCTEGGGWNFEPMSGGMNFALGVGATSNSYMTNFTSSQTPLSALSSGWHMFTGTFDGINKKIYIDGELKGSVNTTQGGTTLTEATSIFYNKNNVIFIGAEAGGSAITPVGNYFNGSLSDFRIYATALSADDILTMYKNSGIIDNNGNEYGYEFAEESSNILNITPVAANGTGSVITYPLNNDYRKAKIIDGTDGLFPGLRYNHADLPMNKTYKLSFNIKVTEGTVNTIGGHSAAFTLIDGVYIDGRKVSASFASPTIAEQKTLLNDGKVHYLEVILRKDITAGDSNLYIQLNRNTAHVSGSGVELYNIKLEEYDSTAIANINKNGIIKGYFNETDLETKSCSLSNQKLWTSNNFLEI